MKKKTSHSRFLENLSHDLGDDFFSSSKIFILVGVFGFCSEGKPYFACITEEVFR